VLVERGAPRCVIVVDQNASPVVLETAHDLSDILWKMSGARVPVASERPRGRVILLGKDEQDRNLTRLEYHAWRDGNVLHLSGSTDYGTVNAVYAFLENELGCRWYTPDSLGEHIPTRRTVAVKNLDMRDAPDFATIGRFGSHRQPGAGVRWLRRNRLLGFPVYFASHNWDNIVPRDLFDSHPEYFALLGSGRSTKQLCTTNPAVIESAVVRVRRFFDERPDYASYSLSPNDNTSFCRCPNCLALDAELGVDPFAEGGSITDRLMVFFNRVAEQVAVTHPDRRLSSYMYLNYTAPPRVVIPHPMVLPELVHTPWEFCQHHSIDDPECERNRRFAKYVRGWCKATDSFTWYDYWGHWYLCGFMGLVGNIRRDIGYMDRYGLMGIQAESHEQWWTQTLNIYVPVKLGWDRNADVDAIVSGFYRNMFGPAAASVARFGAMFEHLVTSVPKDAARDFEQAFLLGFTPAFHAQARGLLDEANRALATASIAPGERQKITERLRRYRYGLLLTEMQAREVQDRRAGRMERVFADLDSLRTLFSAMEADSGLSDAVDVRLAVLQNRTWLERTRQFRDIWEDPVRTPERRVELSLMLDAGETRRVAKELGFVLDWHIIGLWPNPGGPASLTHYEPEDTRTPFQGHYGRSGLVPWRECRSEDPFGTVDLRAFFRPENVESTVAYAYTEFTLSAPRQARIQLFADDDIAIWVNDRIAFGGKDSRTTDVIVADIPLRTGKNVLFVKILNRTLAFKFSVRITTPDGAALPELQGE